MSTDKKLSSLHITAEKFAENSIANMASIPSRPSAFGAASLTPTQVKERFDANPELIRQRFNELLEMLPGIANELVVTVNVNGADETVTLAELIASLSAPKGALQMQDILKVTYGGVDKTIREIVDAITKNISDIGEEVDKLPDKTYVDEADKAVKHYADEIGYTRGLEIDFPRDINYNIITTDYYACVVGYVTGDIKIPPTYKGLPVKEIGMHAFYGDRVGYRNLTSVIIPETIEIIGEEAFSAQFSLGEIILMSKPKEIRSVAFDTHAYYELFNDGKGLAPLNIHVPFGEDELFNWFPPYAVIHYNSPRCTRSIEALYSSLDDEVKDNGGRILSLEAKVENLIQGGGGGGAIGDINTALEAIIARQTSVIGGIG